MRSGPESAVREPANSLHSTFRDRESGGLTVTAGFPAARRTALMRVVERCTVHNSITQPPAIRIGATAREDVA